MTTNRPRTGERPRSEGAIGRKKAKEKIRLVERIERLEGVENQIFFFSLSDPKGGGFCLGGG